MKDCTAEEVVTKLDSRPTMRALLYVLGSPCMELFRESIYVSLRKGPPTRAPEATFGLGSVESSHLKPSLHLVLASAGIDAPLWWTYCGNLSPYPTR